MASGIARGRVRTTTTMATTMESSKMVAILQIIGWQRHAAWLTMHHVMINWHLSNQVIRWPVSSDHITGSSFIKVDRWPSTGFWLDGRLMSGELDESRAGLKSKPNYDCFSSANVFCLQLSFCVSGFVITKLKIEGQTICRKLYLSYKTQLEIQPYPGLA